MAGLIMREGTTFLIRIATSWPMPTFRPEAVADIHSPTGTKLKNGMIAKVGSGSFIWPVPNYKYVSRWMGNGHRGADICAAYGTPIYASDSGTVIAAGWHYSYGNYVEIDHGNGFITWYGHNSDLYVSVGDHVYKGQTIAAMGSTGISSGSHCDFRIQRNGTMVDPLNYLP